VKFKVVKMVRSCSPVLDGLLHFNLWCGQSTTSSFC